MLNYIKRRFSSTDIAGEGLENSASEETGYNPRPFNPSNRPFSRAEDVRGNLSEDAFKKTSVGKYSSGVSQTHAGPTYPSAPSSPTMQGGFGFVGTITGQLSKTKNLFSTDTLNAIIGDNKTKQGNRESYKILLVIDHSSTDWSKYLFKRKLLMDIEVRVEQAPFSDICISANPEQGCIVTVLDSKGNRSLAKKFRPDLVLIRQGFGASQLQYENIITGLLFGGVPCINSIQATYNMKNRAWLFCHLLQLQKRLGVSEFPLISRSFQVKCQPMTPDFPLPITMRIGGDTTRECEVKTESIGLFQSLINLANTTQRYAICEPCLNSVCEIYIQKIGQYFKAFVRKPIANTSPNSPATMVLEKIPLTSKFLFWITEVSRLFEGLDMCAIKAVQCADGEYQIVEVFGSEFALLGDGQEEDRTHIAELVVQRMEQQVKQVTSQVTQPLTCITTSIPSSTVLDSTLQRANTVTSQSSAPIAKTSSSSRPAIQSFNDQPFSFAHGHDEGDPWASRKDDLHTSNTIIRSQSGVKGLDSLIDTGDSRAFDPFSVSTVQPKISQDFGKQTSFGQKISPDAQSTNFQPSMFGSLERNKGDKYAMHSSFGEKTDFGGVSANLASISLGHSTERNAIDPWSVPLATTASTTPTTSRPSVPPRQTSLLSGSGNEDADDTMKNLRKTFAGIFGDI